VNVCTQARQTNGEDKQLHKEKLLMLHALPTASTVKIIQVLQVFKTYWLRDAPTV
jgi:hypothetical protein